MLNESYYISTGELTRMYTLRHTWDDIGYTKDDRGNTESYVIPRDWHVQNLSTDVCKAMSKAKALTGRNLKVDFSLEDITRRNAEQMELARAKAEEAAAKREKEVDEEEAVRQGGYRGSVEDGRMPFGKYAGEKIADVPGSYLLYMLKQVAEPRDVGLKALQNYIRKTFPELANLPEPNQNYFGSIGLRVVATATIVESFGFAGAYGPVNVVKLVAKTGECLVYRGSASIGPVGETLKIRFGIKDHDEYKGQATTYIQRVKEIEE